MNTLELLMGMDLEKITAPPTKKVRIGRLSKIAGADFDVTIRAISGRRLTSLTGRMAKSDGGVDFDRVFDANVRIVLAGIVDPDVKDKELLERFHAATPADLVETLFNGGEIIQLADEIRTLSGYGEDSDAEDDIKN